MMFRHSMFAGVGLLVGMALASPGAALAGDKDQQFVQEAASGGKMEVELGRHASRHAASPEVKRFGERMVSDHGKANEELERLAEKKSIPLPKDLPSKHDAMVKRLTALKGADFDREYMKAMVEDHEHDVEKFREMSTSAETTEVKTFAQKTLPTLEEHLKMAKDIAARVEKHASTAGAR